MARQTVYRTPADAARAYLAAAKRAGAVTVLGGGWWQLQGWRKPVQGLSALAGQLARRGLLSCQDDGRAQLQACPTCGGAGQVTADLDGQCDTCGGTGYALSTTTTTTTTTTTD